MIKKPPLTISNIVISSAFGWGNGVPILKFFSPSYGKLLQVAKERHTTVIAKSVSFRPKKGKLQTKNPISWLQNIKRNGGTLYNSFGLTNDGSGIVSEISKQLKEDGYKVIPSIYAENEHDLTFCLYDFLPKKALEINGFCPNTDFCLTIPLLKTMVNAIRLDCNGIVIILKIGIETPMEFVEEFELCGGDVVHSINTIPTIYKGKKMGMSGEQIFVDSIRHNKKVRKITKLPMIMGGGVSSIDNAQAMFDIGADAVSLCTLAILNPKKTIEVISHYNV